MIRLSAFSRNNTCSYIMQSGCMGRGLFDWVPPSIYAITIGHNVWIYSRGLLHATERLFPWRVVVFSDCETHDELNSYR